jgi:hypothetical protein
MSDRLEQLINDGPRWLRYEKPFPHVVASDVFRPAIYDAMVGQFGQLLARGCVDHPMPADTQFSRGMGSYDAYGYNFTASHAGAFRVLLSRAWCDLLAGLFGVAPTHHVNIGLHHHAVGSASGWPHSDLAPGWFAEDAPGEDMTLSDHSKVDYQNGTVFAPALRSTEEVRAVAALIYLANPEWHPGDGGETGLYGGPRADVHRPLARVAPVNNTLLAFECTPFSFHTFLSNVRTPRNSIVMWLHRPKNEVLDRWGDRPIVYWGARAA